MKGVTEKQEVQEEEYDFPYHYLDLKCDQFKLIARIPYLNILDIVKGLLKPYHGQTILDAGCGDGRLCYELKSKNVKVTGVDYSERAINFARGFSPEVDFFVQDLKHLNLPYKFDCIVLMETLEHLPPNHIPKVLKNIVNHLTEDGTLIVTVPHKNRQLEKKHYQHFTEKSLRNTLTNFEIIRIYGYAKRTWYEKPYRVFVKLGYLLFPFRRFIYKYYDFLYNYYKKFLAKGESDECYGLIAVCKKL